MAVFPAPDAALLRGDKHTLSPVTVNVTPRVILATAEISQTVFTYPLAEIQITNAVGIGNAKPGHLVLIGTAPGAGDVTAGVIRKASNSSILYIDAKSQGDPGYPRAIHAALEAGLYITVLKWRPAWGLLSSIRKGVFYKAWDIAYNGEGVNPPPVVLMGEWRQAWVNDSGFADVDFSAAESFAWGSRTITGFDWNLDGGSVISGSASSSGLTGRFSPGFYEIECLIQDSASRARTGYRYLWVNTTDPDSPYRPFNWRNPIQITDDRQEDSGREIAIEFLGNLDEELLPGAGFLITTTPRFNGQTLSSDSRLVKSFTGYLTDKTIVTSFKRRNTGLTLASPFIMAKGVPAVTQQINEVSAPSDWTECTKTLSNPVGAIWYIAAHHAPYLIDGHDFTYESALLELRRKSFVFQSDSIADQMLGIAPMFLGAVGNKSNGRLRMVRIPHYLTNAERNAMDELWEWTPSDVAGELNYPFTYRMAIGQVKGYAYGYSGGEQATPFESLAPGYVKAQAGGVDSMTPFIVRLTDGQGRVDAITGHHFARVNNPTPRLTFDADRNLDFIEPIDKDFWHRLNIPAKYDSEGVGWQNIRMVPTRVTRRWAFEAGTRITVTPEFEPETFGIPGIPQPINRGGANNYIQNTWNPSILDPYAPVMPDLGLTAPVMLAWNLDGVLGRSFTFAESNVLWAKINSMPSAFTGRLLDAAIDLNSDYFTDPAEPLVVYIVTIDDDTIKVWKCDDILKDFPAWAEPSSYAGTWTVGAGFKNKARIRAPKDEPGFVFVAWKDQTGVIMSRTSLAGVWNAWASPAHVGATVSDSGHDDDDLGVDIYGEFQVILAPTGDYDAERNEFIWQPYYATVKNGAFSPVGGIPTDYRALLGHVSAASPTTAYVSMIKPEPPAPPPALTPVTFEPGTTYPYSTLATVANGIGRNGSYGAYSTVSWTVGATGLVVDIDLGADYLIDRISIDRRYSQDNGVAILSDVRVFSRVLFQDSDNNQVGQTTYFQDCQFPTSNIAFGSGVCGWTDWLTLELTGAACKLTEPVRKLSVFLNITWQDASSSGVDFIRARLDNITITGTLVPQEFTRKLYLVEPGAPAWTDITPTMPAVPITQYGMGGSADSVPMDEYVMSARNEQGYDYLLSTTSGGTSWSRRGRSKYTGFKKAGGIVLGWGYNQMVLSDDNMESVFDRRGDWLATIGALGEIRGMAGVIE